MNPFSRGEYMNIIVRNARTHIEEGRARFTDYEVELKTNHISFALKQSKVRRRYSDFVWLRDRLAKDLMISAPPSLPGRRLFGRFNTDFIKQRQRKLQDFLNKVVKNNVFLSHVALHLFLQSKMTVEEIEAQIDSKIDEDACETILSESAFQDKNEAGCSMRDRLPSKHDSGIESSGHYEGDSGDVSSVGMDKCDQEQSLVDGNAADSEDNAEEENDLSDDNCLDDDDVERNFRKLQLTSLLASAVDQEKQDLESSVEFSLERTSESDDDVIDEDQEIETGITMKSPTRKLSTGSNTGPRRMRRRSRRRRKTCIPELNLSEGCKSKDDAQSSSPGLLTKQTFMRRCFRLIGL
ncbi:sorting nexin-10A-like [Rhopilema esculentum]|uniref:sorting nexin-10A-like n=1 Tax=Rhopilema esculentum TaxID=499914 RepID=UPI0031D881B4